MSFITELNLYRFSVITLGLKNVGATYQRLVNNMFKDLSNKTMKVYIDDIII